MSIEAISAYSAAAYSSIAGMTAVNRKGMLSSLNKLSSGMKINNAGDSPSGLAMSERLRSLIGRYDAAIDNSNNAVSYLETADGFLQNVQNTLGRMQELAVSANDGTKSDADRQVLAAEFEELKTSITGITSGESPLGSFNGIPLFQGESISVAVGPEHGEEMALSSSDLTVSSILETGEDHTGAAMTWAAVVKPEGDGGLSITTQAGAAGSIEALSAANDYVSRTRAVMGAQQQRVLQTIEGLRSAQVNSVIAESGIRDTDVAQELISFNKYQAMTGIGYNMLASGRQAGSVLAVA